MYESFYGLREKPFNLSPDSDFLYLSKAHKAALSRLEYVLVSQPGLSVITGDNGTGKSIIVRTLLKKKYNNLSVGLVANTAVDSYEELLKWILFSFDLECKGDKVDMYHALMDFLVEQFSSNKRAIIIIDEAQNLNEQCLEQLRMLTNVNTDKNELLQIILIGETSLRKTLELPSASMQAFVQRLAVDCHLENLSQDEVGAYIAHRLMHAGASEDIFTAAACQRVFIATTGNPRLINTICDTSLLYGFAEGKKAIDEDLIDVVVREKQRSLLPVSS
jgi:type II secretory pathway predicted ATPase ExeA